MKLVRNVEQSYLQLHHVADEYRPHLQARRAGSTGEFLLVAGEDVNGVAAR
jgi:hypothetical protein